MFGRFWGTLKGFGRGSSVVRQCLSIFWLNGQNPCFVAGHVLSDVLSILIIKLGQRGPHGDSGAGAGVRAGAQAGARVGAQAGAQGMDVHRTRILIACFFLRCCNLFDRELWRRGSQHGSQQVRCGLVFTDLADSVFLVGVSSGGRAVEDSEQQESKARCKP